MEQHLGGIGIVEPRWPVFGTIGGEDKDLATADDLAEEDEEFFRYLVEPVEVFEDEKQRPAPAGANEEFAQGLERLGLDRLGTRQGRPAAAILDTEEMQQQCAVLVGIQPDLFQGRAQLSGRGL